MNTDKPVLVVTSLDDVTADMVISALNERGVPVVRFDLADLGGGFSFSACIGDAGGEIWAGPIVTGTRSADLLQVRSVYWRSG